MSGESEVKAATVPASNGSNDNLNANKDAAVTPTETSCAPEEEKKDESAGEAPLEAEAREPETAPEEEENQTDNKAPAVDESAPEAPDSPVEAADSSGQEAEGNISVAPADISPAKADTPSAEPDDNKLVDESAQGEAPPETTEEADTPDESSPTDNPTAKVHSTPATAEASDSAAESSPTEEGNMEDETPLESTGTPADNTAAKADIPSDEAIKPAPPESADEVILASVADEAAKPNDIPAESAPVEGASEPENKTAEDIPATDTTTTLATAPEEPIGLQHNFAPGDHVIRWEMLPIVWPIQIHGIVLEVNQTCVTICDFGLTAEMRQEDKNQEESSIEESLNENSKKGNKRLQEAWEKVKPTDNRKKERLTVHIMTTQEEIKPWKKVHYGHGLFGMGDDSEEGGANGAEPKSPKKGHIMTAKVGNWFKRVNKNIHENIQHRRENRQMHRHQQQQQNAKLPPAHAESTPESKSESFPAAPKTEGSLRNSNSSPALPTTTTTTTNGDAPSTKNFNHSDPMLTLNGASNHTETSNNSSETPGQIYIPPKDDGKPEKEKNKLPESDPPKLVLARTRLLLQQGEAILPPYHPFKSNSECIAVFCKTGYWRTLQASVFLHSTGICNAKSGVAMTLGVAASVPLLAPAVALAGAAMVGAPYVILKQSHKTWEEATARLTDAFWQQASNEVFVECIEHWSGLIEDDDAKKEEEGEKEDLVVKEELETSKSRFVSV